MKVPEHILRNRHTKVARGMTKTAYRSKHTLNGPALQLSVRGTTDSLSHGLTWRIKRTVITRLSLNDSGKQRLERLKGKRNATTDNNAD